MYVHTHRINMGVFCAHFKIMHKLYHAVCLLGNLYYLLNIMFWGSIFIANIAVIHLFK